MARPLTFRVRCPSLTQGQKRFTTVLPSSITSSVRTGLRVLDIPATRLASPKRRSICLDGTIRGAWGNARWA
jgi:hypothetical protein